MSIRKVAGACFVVLMAFVLVGPLIGTLPYQGRPEDAILPVGTAVLGLVWMLAVWLSLVSVMVFLIAWTVEGYHDAYLPTEEAQPVRSIAPAAGPGTPQPVPLAKAS